MAEQIRRTQLYEAHLGTATLTTFAGFEMPLYYRGIIPEHLAVRNGVGLFDISHMGRVIVAGTDAERYLNYVITNDVSKLLPGSAQYSVMCTPNGGIIDDFLVYRLETERFLLVPNASNRQKDFNWLQTNTKGFNVKLEEVSHNVAMLAVQGPEATNTLQKLSNENLREIERFKCRHTEIADTAVFLSRTGYTGEDGFEIFVWNSPLTNSQNALNLWKSILETGKPYGIEPCGLGARDTLRLEAGLCLYGNDIDETTTPLEAGLGFVVKLQKESFIAKDVLQKQKTEGVKRKRIGILMTEQGIPRAKMDVLNEKGEKIGQLTSGTFSPLLKIGVGMAYIEAAQAQEGAGVSVRIRDKFVKAKIAPFPLYDPEKYGSKRKALSDTSLET